jgi:hypothetical protein
MNIITMLLLDVHRALQEVYNFFEDEYSKSARDCSAQKINTDGRVIIVGGGVKMINEISEGERIRIKNIC